MDNDFINQFKQTIESIVDVKLTNYGITRYVAAIVKKVNSNGTVDVILPPDDKNVISSLANKSGEFLRVGDSVEICTKNGKMSNAWVSTKHGKNANISFPVGFIVMTATNTNPQDYLGGVWTAFGQGKMLVGVDTTQSEFDTVLKTGGEKEVTLSVEQMPSHGHTITHAPSDASLFSAIGETELDMQVSYTSGGFHGWRLRSTADNTGGGQAHNNMSPYITVYMWRRTA